MKMELLSANYADALGAAVIAGSTEVASAQATKLGKQAQTLGLGMPDLVSIHEHALVQLMSVVCDEDTDVRVGARATVFFSAMMQSHENAPIPGLMWRTGILTLRRVLRQRTLELAGTDRKLRTSIAKRKRADASLEASRAKSARLLEASQVLEGELKEITQKLLITQEVQRKKMSAKLHDEIAMALLGIYVRLLVLQREVANKHSGLTREIATIGRLVDQVDRTIKKFNQEFGIQDDI